MKRGSGKKRKKQKAQSVSVDLLRSGFSALDLVAQFALEEYEHKDGLFPSALLAWSPVLSKVLAAAPSAVIEWSCLKKAFSHHLHAHPRHDPFLHKKDWSVVDSSEELATGVARMFRAIRKMALYTAKRNAGLNKCRTPEEAEAIHGLLAAVKVDDTPEDSVVVCVSSDEDQVVASSATKRALRRNVSVASSATQRLDMDGLSSEEESWTPTMPAAPEGSPPVASPTMGSLLRAALSQPPPVLPKPSMKVAKRSGKRMAQKPKERDTPTKNDNYRAELLSGGWTVRGRTRFGGRGRGHIYFLYISPGGRAFRSIPEVRAHLAGLDA